MKKIENWDGQLENTRIEYIQEQRNDDINTNSAVSVISAPCDADYQKADKTDYIVESIKEVKDIDF